MPEKNVWLLIGIGEYRCDTWQIRTSKDRFSMGDAIRVVKEQMEPEVDQHGLNFELVAIQPELALDADE